MPVPPVASTRQKHLWPNAYTCKCDCKTHTKDQTYHGYACKAHNFSSLGLSDPGLHS